MKTKNAAVLLIIGSGIWIVNDIYWTFQRFVGGSHEYYRTHPLYLILSTLLIVVPISLVLLGVSLLKKNDENEKEPIVETIPQQESASLSVGDWLVTFLITCIPVVGLIFIIIWASDNNNKTKKNWAIASLIWGLIVTVITIIIYVTIFVSAANAFR
jgi:cytochrome bd-type quinol oxidase subunit 2